MLTIDNFGNYLFVEFDDYCKINYIVIVGMFIYSFHILQPLDVALYLFLKVFYGC